jgi:hypothetical protein
MRLRSTVLVSLLTTLGVAGVADAAPRHNHGLTLATVPSHISAGDPVLLYGRLGGPNAGERTIRLYHRIAGAARFTYVSRTKTDSAGRFEFTRADGVVLTNRRWFVRGPDGSHSRTVAERVDPLVSLVADTANADTLHTFTLSGAVAPGHAGEAVLLQERSGTGDDWHTVRSGRLGAGSTYAIPFRRRVPGEFDLRTVFPGDRRNTRGASDPVTLTVQQAQRPGFTITSAAPVITVGETTTLGGVLSGGADAPVTLLERVAGSSGFSAVATTTASADGGYSFTVAPAHNTWFMVRTEKRPAKRTAVLYEAVRYAVTARSSTTSAHPGETVTFSGTVIPSRPGGEVVYLQRLGADGDWHTVGATITNAAAAYTVTTSVGSAPSERFRVRALGDGLNRTSVSPVTTVTVTSPPVSTLPPAS